jgi:hypothetical protein
MRITGRGTHEELLPVGADSLLVARLKSELCLEYAWT